MRKYRYQILFFVAALFFLTGCDQNEDITPTEEPGDKSYPVTYTVSIFSDNDPNASDNEMMKRIYLIVANSANVIEKIVDINLPSTQEVYESQIELSLGNKNVYGFANLTDAMMVEAGISGLSEGNPMPNLTNSVCTINNGYLIDEANNQWLPMSNKTAITVSNVSGQAFALELVRMLSKVKFNFQNKSGYTIRLDKVTITPVTTSSVYLLPSASPTIPTLPAGTTTGDYTHTFDSGFQFGDKGTLEYTTYLNESMVENDRFFRIKLQTENMGTSTIEERITLMSLNSLNRNDYLPLTIILTDYKLELELLSYPPIGGYPAKLEVHSDGFYCSFPGGGPFVIIPHLMRLSDNTEITLTDSDWTFTLADVNPTIFDKIPVLENGEISGVIKPASTGRALCDVSVTISESEGISRVLSYKLYISQN